MSKMSKVRVRAVAYTPPALFVHNAVGRARLAAGSRNRNRSTAAALVLRVLGDCGGEHCVSRRRLGGERISVAAGKNFTPKKVSE